MVIFNLHNVKNAVCELSESKKVVIKNIYLFLLPPCRDERMNKATRKNLKAMVFARSMLHIMYPRSV